MTALRSFVAVADSGGVTRAAGFLNLTQSAVSMQLKRLEESLGIQLLDRTARTIALTPAGDQLLTYARRMLRLNDEVFTRLTSKGFEGEIVLGVPHDIVYPAIPQVLRQFASNHPRMKIQLVSSHTTQLKEKFKRGECDIIVTTEKNCDAGGQTLKRLPLVWVGAIGGNAWKTRPLQLAFEQNCIFRKTSQDALDDADISWDMMVVSEFSRTVEATISADLAVHTVLEGAQMPYLEPINHGGTLPDLLEMNVNMYVADFAQSNVAEELATLVRQAYS
jgi:DNA-binding transcriptional LysR family regulator